MARAAHNPQSSTRSEEIIPYGSLSHDDINRAFCTVLNTIKPEHPYHDDAIYPVAEDQVDYTYNRASGPYYATCGPRRSRNTPVAFSADKKSFNHKSPERILAILVHEVTHITVGSHSTKEHGSHPPRFWREYGFNAHVALDNWEQLETVFGPLNPIDFIGYIVDKEVNKFNIDRRYGSVQMRRQEMARWFESTLKRLSSE